MFYEQRMAAVITSVADLIGGELDAAKAKIAAGRAEIRAYVAKQPKELQKLAGKAATDINGKFDQLESDVDDKQNALVEDLAQRYVEARNAVDEEIKAEQAKGEGLVDMAKNAVGESVRAILALKDMFLNLLSRAASAFTMILDAPVRFITNFMKAVKQGFLNFADNILTHLKKGLQSWLFGQLSASGIELPDKFDLMGVLKMIASMLGLTWANIKARIVAADPFVGKVIDVVESKIEIFTKLAKMGISGVWEWIKEKVGDVKQMIFDKIKSFVIERVVKAGITWVLGMLNPAGALFKIVQALINVVQWIMEKGAEMGEFIGTIIDAVMDIARGGGGGVPAKIESALGKAVPLVLSFLASLLGLGGISTKVREFLAKAGEQVMKGVDWVVKKALTMARPLIRALKAGAGWATKKFEAGKAWVKGKYEAGKAYVKKKYEGAKAWVKKKYEGAKGWVKGKASAAGAKVTGAASAALAYLRAQCDKLLRIAFRDKFDADGEAHSLYTQPGAPADLYVASTPSPLVAAFADAEPAPRTEITSLDRRFRTLMREHQARAKALRGRSAAWLVRNGPGAKAELAAIASLGRKARDVQNDILAFVKKHIKSRRAGPGAHAPGIGAIAPWSAQPGKMRGGTRQIKEWRMEAEHIIPDGLFRRALLALTRSGRVTDKDTGYERQTTILIYQKAAKTKTGGTPQDAVRGGDQDLINRMGNVAGMIRSRAGGFGDHRKRPPPEGAEPKRYWRTYLKDQFDRRVEPLFNSLSSQALARTKSAVKAEQQKVKDGRGPNAATRPSDSELQASYASQKGMLDEVLKNRLENADFEQD